ILGWNDNIETDVDGYNVYRSPTSGSGYSKINGSLVPTSNYTDTGLYGGGTYYYKVTAVDNATAESDYSNEDYATANNTVPAAPTGLTATADDEEISLDWNDNIETDLDGYNVHRSDNSGGPYSQVNGSLVSTSNYTDTALYGGGTYYYVVTAVDNVTAESGYSSENYTTANNIAPLAPTGLVATGGDEEISLDWNDNIETDMDGYNVYRSLTSGDNYTQINVGLVVTSNYTDTGLYTGGTYYYVVTAVDNATAESGSSNEHYATANTIPPVAPTGLVATDGVEEISLDWNDNSESDLDGYNVYRGDTGGGPYNKINGAILVETSNYTNTGLYAGGTYYYVVRAVDLGNNESSNSNEDSATANATPPAAPTGLIATPGDSQVTLDWDDNSEGDLAGYNVYRGLTSGNYTQVNPSLVVTSNYTDTGRSNGATYYYAVTAVDNYTAESGYSNEASAAPMAPPQTVLSDGFESGTFANWDGNGATDWTAANYNSYIGSWAARHNSGNTYLTTDDLDTSSADNITISFWFQVGSLTKGPTYVQIYNGTSYNTLHDLFVYPGVVATSTYYQYSENISDSQYFRSDFRLRFDGSSSTTDVYIDEVLITMGVMPPVEPTGLVATAGDEEVSLDWNDNVETDLDGYNVYRGLTSGNYTKINGSLVSTSNYTDTGLTNDITYYYVVTAVDLGSNESAYSNEDSAAPANAPPSPPTGLAATAGDFEVDLDWSDNTEPDLDGYNVYRSLTTGTGYSKINVSLVSTSNYTDTGLSNNTTYYYVVTAVDNLSAESDYSNEDSVVPNIAPAAPTGLIATAGDEQVSLNWNDNSEADLDGYNIFRGLSSGNYTKIESLWATSNYTDTGLTNDITYYYAVTAVDNVTAESDYSDEATATPGDPPPAAPTGLVATPGDKQASLDWNDNGEGDLDGYNVYRSLTSGSDYDKINGSLLTTSNYTDTGLTDGETYYYVVTAVDTLANESGYSDEANATPTDPPPAAPTNLVANPGDKQVSLGWDDNTEGDLDAYNIYRGLISGNYTQIESLWSSSSYTDTGLTGGETYYYAVTAVDLGSHESSTSNETSATPTDPPPAAPTTLVATAGNTQVSLGWDENTEDDLDAYNIYRGTTPGNYTQIESLWSSISYTDTGLTNGVTYYYVVTAVDLASNESGNSNEDSAMPFNPPITLIDDGFEGTPWDANWNDNETTDWQASFDGGGYGGTGFAAHHTSGDTYLTSDDMDASAADNMTISFWFNIKLLNKGSVWIQTYNGTSYNNWFDLTSYASTKNTWLFFSEVITDSQYSISDFRIRFDGTGVTTDAYIDDVLIVTNE
ncbi:fibronectin type III domain-containing protein, partial [Chloroflexota bacterium]